MSFEQQINEHLKRIQATVELGDTARGLLASTDALQRAEAFDQLVTVNHELQDLLREHKQLADSQNLPVIDGETLFRLDYEAIKELVAPDKSSKKRRVIQAQGLHVFNLEGFQHHNSRIIGADLRRHTLAGDACTHLRKLHALKTLRFSAATISSLDALKSHPSLEQLFVSEGDKIQSLAVLTTLPRLSTLALLKSKVDNAKATCIFSLSSLTSLDLSSNPLSSLHGIQALPNLEHFSLWRSPVTDLSPLASMTSLRTLSIGHLATDDLTPLLKIPNLSTLQISDKLVTRRGALAWFTRPARSEQTIELLRKKGVKVVTMA
jgi:hypothetical protein